MRSPDFGIVAGLAVFVLLCASLPYMSIRAGVVVAVALHEVDNAPDTKPGSQSYNKGLQNAYCRIKKCHKSPFLPRVRLPEKGHKKRRSVLVTAAVISPPGWAGSPRRLSVCGAAVFSCKGCGFCRCVLRRGSGGAYHVACVYVPDSDTSFKVFALMNERKRGCGFRRSSRHCGNVYNCLAHGVVGNAVCRTWESCPLLFHVL